MVFVPKSVTVEASSVYVGSTCVGNNLKITLPEVTPSTTDVDGLMGTMSVPLLNTLEDMEATVTKVGTDENTYLLTSPGTKDITAKWVQDRVSSDGTVTPVGCSAQLKCMPKVYSPEEELEIGSATESDIAFSVYEYKKTVDGKVVFWVNRLTSTLKVWNGKELKDYSSSFAKFL